MGRKGGYRCTPLSALGRSPGTSLCLPSMLPPPHLPTQPQIQTSELDSPRLLGRQVAMEVHRPPGDSLGPPAQDRGLAPHQGPLVSGDHMGLASSLLGPQI